MTCWDAFSNAVVVSVSLKLLSVSCRFERGKRGLRPELREMIQDFRLPLICTKRTGTMQQHTYRIRERHHRDELPNCRQT